jgi:leader peptidase (prepilin peptidase) / N-methyltransferase
VTGGVATRRLLSRTETTAALAVGAGLAGASFARYGAGGHALVGALLGPSLSLLTAIDLRHRLLPNIIVLPAAGAVVVAIAAAEPSRLLGHAAYGLGLYTVFLVFALAIPGGIGMGDAKLALLIGVSLGSRTLPAMIFTSLGSLVVTLVLLVRHGRAALKLKIPFGPLLAVGALAAYFGG